MGQKKIYCDFMPKKTLGQIGLSEKIPNGGMSYAFSIA